MDSGRFARCGSRRRAARHLSVGGQFSQVEQRSWLRRAIQAALVMPVAWSLPSAAGAADQASEVFATFGGLELRGRSPHYADFGVGVFGLSQNVSAAGRIEVRAGEKWWFLGPAVGLVANTDGGVYGYGGVYADIAIGNVVVTPLAGLGGYRKGSGRDLGGVFQFRLSLGVSYEFADGSRLGLNVGHLSNAGTQPDNPGQEEVYLSYAIPF
ncbi:MAG: acyloxyacyl hydrolase [Rhodospirillales bacterium]|nr:MAG: acyloxyacyl hydrolase [Rhodospirillales bacterium]